MGSRLLLPMKQVAASYSCGRRSKVRVARKQPQAEGTGFGGDGMVPISNTEMPLAAPLRSASDGRVWREEQLDGQGDGGGMVR